MELKEYNGQILRVNIDDVIPNTWNPKLKNHDKVEYIKDSIKLNGFKQPVQVREHPTLEGKYEIIDGEQRWTAMKGLGATEIYVYNNGQVSDEDAKSETIWWQVQVPFETIALAELVTELAAMEMELPYSSKELAEFKEMTEYEGKENPADGETPPDGFKTFKVRLGDEAFDVVQQALSLIKDEYECNDARALELMCGDYLAGN